MATNIVVVENEIENKQEKKVVVPRSASEIQRFKLEKLLKKSVRLFIIICIPSWQYTMPHCVSSQ